MPVAMPKTIELILYSRPQCHLCDEMKVVIDQVRADYDLRLSEVDIDTDPELQRKYTNDIPVLLVNDMPAFRWRLQEVELRARLDRALISDS